MTLTDLAFVSLLHWTFTFTHAAVFLHTKPNNYLQVCLYHYTVLVLTNMFIIKGNLEWIWFKCLFSLAKIQLASKHRQTRNKWTKITLLVFKIKRHTYTHRFKVLEVQWSNSHMLNLKCCWHFDHNEDKSSANVSNKNTQFSLSWIIYHTMHQKGMQK